MKREVVRKRDSHYPSGLADFFLEKFVKSATLMDRELDKQYQIAFSYR